MKKTHFPLLSIKRIGLLALAFVGLATARGQEITFYTPRTVHVVKSQGEVVNKNSQVVIAAPEKVKVRTSVADGVTTYATSALIVKVEQGRVSFYDGQGGLLTAEGTSAFTPITEGPDKGAYRVKQTFCVEADEGIYGIGLVQNGKMSQRGENRRMEQSNLEDYAHIYQSVKGYGVYWEN